MLLKTGLETSDTDNFLPKLERMGLKAQKQGTREGFVYKTLL